VPWPLQFTMKRVIRMDGGESETGERDPTVSLGAPDCRHQVFLLLNAAPPARYSRF
jgi:hypothetical protein